MLARGPREQALVLERVRRVPGGAGERLAGYGVLGLPFRSGHVLAFRRFTATSIGLPFTSIWHRDPEGYWTVYVDAEPSRSCPRFFGPAADHVVRTEIRLEWSTQHAVWLSIPRDGLSWTVRLTATPRTRAFNGLASLLPPLPWMSGLPALRRVVARQLLGYEGPLLDGHTPTGRFVMEPHRVWSVAATAAVVDGRDMGPLGAMSDPPRLGEYLIPNHAVFVIGQARFTPADLAPVVRCGSTRHVRGP